MSAPRLVQGLERLAREKPLERKLVVSPTFGGGRELLRRLALEGSGWVGFEVTTPRPLALRVAGHVLDERGLSPLDPFDQQALLDEAMDGALQGVVARVFRELSEGVGFREAVHGAVTALRLAGLGSEDLRAARLGNWQKREFLAQVVSRYEGLLQERRRADTGTILAMACEVLQNRDRDFAEVVGADAVLLLPGLGSRGLTGRLMDALHWNGAQVLPTDPVMGMDAPKHLLWYQERPSSSHAFLFAPDGVDDGLPQGAVELFRAGSVEDELREVLRRVADLGLRWDQVEIVAPDPAVYGSALHALTARLGVPVTYAVGLPVERTRPGRVVRAYLEWIRGGFQADPIRRLLEAGDLRPPRTRAYHPPADLARRFRSLRIGWGRQRYRRQIRNALDALESGRPGRWETEERYRRRADRTRGELHALRAILYPSLKATPSVPDRMGEGGGPVSPAELARGMRAFLRRMPKGTGPDATAREELMRILERVEATLRRRTHFEAAATILERHLEIRVRAPRGGEGRVDDQGTPWRSEGGHLHLSDLEHGGFAGREAIFVVGVDADRVPGPGAQDPVLLDGERRALGDALPTSVDVLRERVFRFAAFLSRLRGQVTLSYASWNAADARTVAPSPLLLQALRLKEENPRVSFRDLHEALGRVRSAFPGEGSVWLDGDDVWMAALEDDGVLRRGVETVRLSFPRLDAGLTAAEARDGVPGPHHGVVSPRPDLDARNSERITLSASRLEGLGACPLRYLYASVLWLRPPDDPELDPDRWLDPLQRGTILHAVFEATLRTAQKKGVQLTDAGFTQLALDALQVQSDRAREEIPAPGEGVRRRELSGLADDVRSFVRMLRERLPHWVALELRFGAGEDDALVLQVPGGEIRLRGAVDRVDEDLQGLRVVDYKTGVPRGYGGKTGAFAGGRRLQHAIYAEAAERILGGDVVAGEYHFPTRRGENEVHPYTRMEMAALPELLGHMLDGVGAGSFVPTDEPDDCRFCDFASICRVREGGFGKVESPMAEWSKEYVGMGLSPAFQHLRKVRDFEK